MVVVPKNTYFFSRPFSHKIENFMRKGIFLFSLENIYILVYRELSILNKQFAFSSTYTNLYTYVSLCIFIHTNKKFYQFMRTIKFQKNLIKQIAIHNQVRYSSSWNKNSSLIKQLEYFLYKICLFIKNVVLFLFSMSLLGTFYKNESVFDFIWTVFGFLIALKNDKTGIILFLIIIFSFIFTLYYSLKKNFKIL